MRDAIEVIKPGTRVMIAGITSTVTAVQIGEAGHVLYLVVWWDGRTRKSEWVESSEVSMFLNDSTTRIGFQAA